MTDPAPPNTGPPIPPVVISPYLATAENTRRFAKYDPADGFLVEYGTVAVGFLDDQIANSEPVIEVTVPYALGLETHKVDLGTLQIAEMTPEDVQARKDKYTPPAMRSLMAMIEAKPITTNDLIIALDEKENGDPSKWQDLLAQAKSNTNGQPS